MGIIVDAEPCDTCGYKTIHALLGGFSSRLCMRIATCNSCSQLVSLRVSHKNLPDILKRVVEETYGKNLENMPRFFRPRDDNDICPNCGSSDVNFVDDNNVVNCPACDGGKIKLVPNGFWD
jgi:hypothetical protein